MKVIVTMVMLAPLLTGCSPVLRLSEWTTNHCPVDADTPVRAVAVCQGYIHRSPSASDSVVFLVGELLQTKYGYDVRNSEWTTALVESLCQSDEPASHYGSLLLGSQSGCGHAMSERGVDVVMFCGIPVCGGPGYTIYGFNPAVGEIALGSATLGPIRSSRITRAGERILVSGSRVDDHAKVLAESIHWLLTHPGETRGSPGRLARDQPWTKLTPSEAADLHSWH